VDLALADPVADLAVEEAGAEAPADRAVAALSAQVATAEQHRTVVAMPAR
jgi:hypothetical protein